ncbi:MAG TPA: hypothetical protein VMX17_17335 [Candidatus Glassbacteria bacterium]|nr:hypothetical protein [Candidatus Glassbacteria bacterium]
MDMKFGVPEKKESTGSKISLFFKSIAILAMIIIAVSFTLIGLIRLSQSLFTSYDLQPLDAIELAGGLSLIFLMAIIVIVTEIKSKVQTIGEAVVVLLKPKPTMPSSPMDFFKNLGGQDGLKGSINIVDLTNGGTGESLFKGDFSNINELHELRNKLLTNMLNSQKEFKGKQITKQEMLDTMTIEELEVERIKAEQDEEWIWAAAVRDKIKEKSQK